MKKYGKVLIIVSVLLVSCIFVTSCKEKKDGNVQILSHSGKKTEVTDPSEKPSIVPTEDSETDMEEEQDYKEALANTVQLPIYCLNEDLSEIETVKIYMDPQTKVTSLFVVEKVVDEFSNHALPIGIDKVSEDDKGTVIVSFKRDTIPVTGVEEEVENLMLDCISQSILDDVESSKAVIFQVEGAAYRSAHNAFKKNEAYNWK